MAYTKTNWENGETPISADNLNHMEQGIYDAHNDYYTKTQSDNKYRTISDSYTKSQVYTKTEADAKYRTKTEIPKYDGTFASGVDLLAGKWSGPTAIKHVNYDYTAPADGFATVSRTSGAPSNGDVTVLLKDVTTIKIKANNDTGTEYKSLYVKKGTVLTVQATSPTESYTSTFIAKFHPYKTV